MTLTWAGLPDAEFELCIDTVNNYACDTTWTDLDDATETTLEDLAAGTYYWQVRATTSGGTTLADAGTWWSFTVNAQGIFGKTSPSGGAYVLTDNVTLAWNSLPDVGYWVCWDTTDNDTCDGGWTPNGASTTKLLEGLSAGTYYWQVKETEEGIQADAGDWWSFTKVTGVTGKLAPLDGTLNHGEDVWLSWSAVPDAGYWTCVDTTDNDTCDGSWYPNGASTTKLIEDLSAGTYYWQVKIDPDVGADYEANDGDWWAFTVGSGVPPASGTATVTREYIYLGGKLLASYESGTTLTYYHLDALGSVRAVTDDTGDTLVRHDYFPFGESASSMEGDPRRFTGKERDAETAFDYFDARYYRNVWGRFTSADDSIFMDPFDPQSFNRYAYVLNNPLRWVDPTGHQAQDLQVNETVIVTAQAPKDKPCRWFCGVDYWAFLWEGIERFNKGLERLSGIHLELAEYGAKTVAEPILIATNPSSSPAEVVGALEDLQGMMAMALPGGLSKNAARALVRNMGLPARQLPGVMSAITRATSTSQINIVRRGDDVVVQISRAGRDGYQVIESIVTANGVKSVIQKAFDAAGRLVHWDGKR